MKDSESPLHLFQGYGVELEYMIVQQDSLKVAPITDKLIYDVVGQYVSDVEFGEIAWSNELALHVVELKTQGPVKSLVGLQHKFQEQVQQINKLLAKYNACLLPTAAHPFMNPETDMHLWPHEYSAVYEAYNRIFDCSGHGWANLQSTHLNLAFANDTEFEKLHAAIRVLLPIIPALSASSPILNGKITGLQDTRLEVYRHNQDKIPSVAGKIIPEAVFNKADYETRILQPMYVDVAPFDPDKVLQDEFLNSRGAIARFSRNAIEIRVIDIQESPVADIAVLQAIVAVLQALVQERWVTIEELKTWDENSLAAILLDVTAKGQEAWLPDLDYVKCFGFDGAEACTAGELWKHLTGATMALDGQPEIAYALHVILSNGNLSKRILKACGENPSEGKMKQVYHELAACLQRGGVFHSY